MCSVVEAKEVQEEETETNMLAILTTESKRNDRMFQSMHKRPSLGPETHPVARHITGTLRSINSYTFQRVEMT
jgi:hypothetical protein